jgi:hypothetical protein
MNKKFILLCAVTVTVLTLARITLDVRAADSTAPTAPSTPAVAKGSADPKAPPTQTTKNTASGSTTATASGANSTAVATGANSNVVASGGNASSAGSNRRDRGTSAPFVGVGGILTISGISEIVLDGNHFMPDTMAHWVAPEKAEDCKIELCTKDGRRWEATWTEVKK